MSSTKQHGPIRVGSTKKPVGGGRPDHLLRDSSRCCRRQLWCLRPPFLCGDGFTVKFARNPYEVKRLEWVFGGLLERR
jgi:hypothetical protein